MKSFTKTGCLLLLALGIALPPAGFASGSYCVCIPKPPSKKAQVDREKYDLGQKVFNGRAALAQSAADPKDQQAKLQSLQGMLPKGTAKKKDLTAMAGKLSGEQLDALEYYVRHRYGTFE